MSFAHLPWSSPAAETARPCLSTPEHTLSYADVEERSAAFAEQLTEAGIGAGDVLGIMLPNSLELLIGLLAAWRVGAAATPINPTFTARELQYQLDDSGAKALLALPGTETGLILFTPDSMHKTPSSSVNPREITGDEVALLIYTSGSTGQPKGVMLDHNNLDAMSSQMVEAFSLTENDHALLVLPLFHVNSLLVSFLSPIKAGAQTTVLERFAPQPFLDAIEQYRPTYFSAVPAIYARLAELPADVVPDVSSLRFAICGAAPVSKELLSTVEERFGLSLAEGYGLTEATCASCVNPIDGIRKPGTVGPALKGQTVAIMDPDGTLLPTGQRGEIVIQGPTVMRGYLGRPEATAEAVRDGWLHTGDVGILDEDGYLQIVDRIKDMIIRGGENLYPKEIEAYLAEHPDVLEAAVIGAPHEVLGEVPVAQVTLVPGSATTADDLIEHCRVGLTKIKVPARIEIVDDLPRNPVGKVDKPRMRREAAPVDVPVTTTVTTTQAAGRRR